MVPEQAAVQSKTQKKAKRRARPEWQKTRRAVQFAFLAVNGWIGLQFFIWVRYFERGGKGLYLPRPAGVEGWLPIAGLMNTKQFLVTGHVPEIHPAAMFLFLAFVLVSLLLKKAFCGWLCPVGTLSEYLWRLGRRLMGRALRIPRVLDVPLRGLKYLLLGFFVLVIATMPAEAIGDFMHTPYGLMADVKMLNFFRGMSLQAAIVIGLLVVGSVLVQNFWCRYMCPYGALMGLVSLLSPMKVRRDAEACIKCGKCAKACPAGLPVDKLVQIRSAECTACMECVSACRVEDALQFALPPARLLEPGQWWARRVASPPMVAGALVCVFLSAVLVARATKHWQTNLPQQMYKELVPDVERFTHPGM